MGTWVQAALVQAGRGVAGAGEEGRRNLGADCPSSGREKSLLPRQKD